MNRHAHHASLASSLFLAAAGCNFDPHGGAGPVTTGSSGGYAGASTASTGNETSTGGTAGAPTGTGGSGGDVPPSPDGGTVDQDAMTPPAPDGGTQVPDSSTGMAHIRIANLGSSAGSFDFCVRRHDSANTALYDIGPVLGSRGVSSGIPQQRASAYFDFESGRYDFRLVAANAPDCTKPLPFRSDAPFFIPYDIASAPEMANDTWWTLVAHSVGNHDNDSFSTFQDEHASVPEKALVRFANVTSLRSAMDFGFGRDATFSLLFANVAADKVGSGDGVDALGYLPIAPASQTYAVDRFAGGAGDVGKLLVDLPAGDVASFYGFNIDFLVVCHDLVPPTGFLSDCQGKPQLTDDSGTVTPPPSDGGLDGTNGPGDDAMDAGTSTNADSTPGVVDAMAHFRIANPMSAIDFCLRHHDATDQAPFDIGPLFASRGYASGILQSKVTMYFDVDPGQYDFRVVSPGATDCSRNLYYVNLTNLPMLTAGSFWTFIPSGTLDKGLAFYGLPDERTADPGKFGVRFVNAEYPTVLVDFGFGTGDSFAPIFTGVDGFYLTHSPATGPGADVWGYVQRAPVSDAVPVLRYTGNSTDAVKGASTSFGAGEVTSFFALGSTHVAPVILCRDLEPADPPWSSCITFSPTPK
jgi:hypothetical protein